MYDLWVRPQPGTTAKPEGHNLNHSQLQAQQELRTFPDQRFGCVASDKGRNVQKQLSEGKQCETEQFIDQVAQAEQGLGSQERPRNTQKTNERQEVLGHHQHG